MNRIEAIFSFIDEKDKVVDVGCDQAKLSKLLLTRNQCSIASDISEKVIKKAKESIKDDRIDFRVSNGLEKINKDEVDTLVLSGMGTHTIIEILSNTKIKFKKIITISNNYHDILREKMNTFGYIVSEEQIIKENNKYYNLILFVPGNKNYSESELLIGLNHKDIDLYKEYLEYLSNKYKIIKKTSEDKNKKVDKMLEIIDKKLKTV